MVVLNVGTLYSHNEPVGFERIMKILKKKLYSILDLFKIYHTTDRKKKKVLNKRSYLQSLKSFLEKFSRD